MTFEGGEGAGKSTLIERLRCWLEEDGREVVVTREPGGTDLAEAVRAILLDPRLTPDGLCELFLFEAARRDHVQRVIRPALGRGAVVLCDRFADSSVVYQGAARGVEAEVVRRLNLMATDGLRPHRTVIVDVDPAVGLARVAQRFGSQVDAPTRIDNESLAFHRRVREGFLQLAAAEPDRCTVVDGNASPETVLADVVGVVREVLND